MYTPTDRKGLLEKQQKSEKIIGLAREIPHGITLVPEKDMASIKNGI